MLSPDQVEQLCEQSLPRLNRMRELIRAQGSALVAFSGGVDSTFVLKVAVEELGERAIALTAISASIAPAEKAEARRLAQLIGARHLEVDSGELSNPEYAKNPTNRCYFCKSELYTICEARRAELGLATVMDGFNADDRKDHRPGQQAARENEIFSPMAEVGLTKDEVRAWSQRVGLPTWDKPSFACLSSRFQYGERITADKLRQVDAAEAFLRSLGFRQFRVRHHDRLARLELPLDEVHRVWKDGRHEAILARFRALGYVYVAVDVAGLQSGSANLLLTLGRARDGR